VLGEVGVERGLRDAIPATIFSGTSDIQRNLVAARLGL
jgi:alkylation response protein AidB-like acyl-CoA dehydrogenase